MRGFDDFLATLSSRKRKAIRKERARRSRGWKSSISPARDRGGALGRLLGLLPGHRRAQMGPALSDARLLLAARRADGRPDAADPRAARRAADRRRAQPDRRRGALRPLLGRGRGGAATSISSFAIIRRSTRRSRAACSGSRRARRARTSWRAAIGRCRPGRPIISPIRASGTRSPIISPPSGARSRARSRRWKNSRRSEKAERLARARRSLMIRASVGRGRRVMAKRIWACALLLAVFSPAARRATHRA